MSGSPGSACAGHAHPRDPAVDVLNTIPAPASFPGHTHRLVPASRFSVDVLTDAYNQTRVDYLVPMPMNADRLAEYIHVYDVELERSLVAVEGDRILGLGLLGVRPGQAWITRLGVLPSRRRRGIGEAIVRGLMRAGHGQGIDLIMLEVIHNNRPAQRLFLKCGFLPMRDLLILRRAPALMVDPLPQPLAGSRWFGEAEALAKLAAHPGPHAWTNESASLRQAGGALGLEVTLRGGGRGWLVCRQQRFILSHITLVTETGDAIDVGQALLAELHARFPRLDTYTENIAIDDPHLPAFFRHGYVETFRRCEMHHRR